MITPLYKMQLVRRGPIYRAPGVGWLSRADFWKRHRGSRRGSCLAKSSLVDSEYAQCSVMHEQCEPGRAGEIDHTEADGCLPFVFNECLRLNNAPRMLFHEALHDW